jgi:regulator of sirC expression with transglutaminase-like and TPR domain
LPHDQLPSSPFARAVDRPDHAIDLARVALLIAQDEYPDLDIDQYLAELDGMAETVRPRVEAAGSPDDVIDVLNAYLFGRLGFVGNLEDYYDPRNSFLNDVLDRRIGIPITLSMIYIEMGRRLDLPIEGIGLPGHFIVRYEGADPVFIDPFNGGERLTEADCRQRLREIFGAPIALRPEWVTPVSNRQILTRVLYNLKGIYIRNKEFQRAIPVVEKLLILNPEAYHELRDLGSLHGMLGNYGEALIHLQQYLVHRPDAPDIDEVRSHMKRLMTQIARWN